MKRIDEHKPGYVRRMRAREGADDERAERMCHEHIRGRNARIGKQETQFGDERVDRARTRGALAPRQTRAVVAAHTRLARDHRVHAAPGERRRRDARFEDDGRRAGAVTPIVEAMAADGREGAGCAESSPVAGRADALIEHARQQQPRDDPEKDGPAHIH